LRRTAPTLPGRKRLEGSAGADVRPRAVARRRRRHSLADLAISRSERARFGLDVRAEPPSYAPGVAREPIRRLPRLRPVAGRRAVLRRQGAGLRVEARRGARSARALR